MKQKIEKDFVHQEEKGKEIAMSKRKTDEKIESEEESIKKLSAKSAAILATKKK